MCRRYGENTVCMLYIFFGFMLADQHADMTLHVLCVRAGHLTARSDVYSFGVVLLEILTGRRAVDKNKPGGEQNLVEWAKPYLNDKRKVFRIIDPRLEGQYSMKGAHRVATLAFSCLYADPRMRPLMKDIVELLEPLLNTREVAKCAYNAGCDPSIRTHPKDTRLYVHNGRRAYNGVYQNGLAQQHQNGSTDGRKYHQQSTKHGDVRQRHGLSPQAAYQMKRPQDPCPKIR